MRSPVQQALPFPRRGGARQGAGRKPRPERKGFVPHVTRPRHSKNHPVHVTMRRVPAGPNFREELVFFEIRRAFAAASERGLRVIHYSVQCDHLHLIVEAADRVVLWRGVQRLFTRIARDVNRVARRRGRLFRDRHHRHDLRTPKEVRNAYVYVLQNWRKHARTYRGAVRRAKVVHSVSDVLDPCSSASVFDGWHADAASALSLLERLPRAGPPGVVGARSWLATHGWRRRGLVHLGESPARS